MPVREQIMMRGEISMGFNLSKPVGDKQSNLRDDVFMVQALLRFIVEAFHGGRMTGMTSPKEVPDFNGRMDAVTLAAVRTFQRRWIHNLITSDGVIHPAQYRFRNITASPRERSTSVDHLWAGPVGEGGGICAPCGARPGCRA